MLSRSPVSPLTVTVRTNDLALLDLREKAFRAVRTNQS